jgi:hypothetical protein
MNDDREKDYRGATATAWSSYSNMTQAAKPAAKPVTKSTGGKPPPSPPSSDIDGVHEDRKPIDSAENAKPSPGEALSDARDESKGRPPGGRY